MPMPVQLIPVPPPASLTTPPPPLPPPVSGQMRDLEANHRQVAQAYHLLASQMCSLLTFLKVHHDAQTDDCNPALAPRPNAAQ